MRTLLLRIGHLWSLPNTLIGLTFGVGGEYGIDRRNRVVRVRGGWMVSIFRRLGYIGMCVGDVVLYAGDLPTDYPAVYRHELVHAVQGRIFGPFYLPLTLAGYLLGFLLAPREAHDASPLEIWADLASGNGHRNRYLRRFRR
ncbi:MAG: hypothetical protein SFU56_00390 [Capsulimonadales bacterium]|nr:hypothetical protein [Capsulimonadales bacterium]